jgi:hypothetical protein
LLLHIGDGCKRLFDYWLEFEGSQLDEWNQHGRASSLPTRNLSSTASKQGLDSSLTIAESRGQDGRFEGQCKTNRIQDPCAVEISNKSSSISSSISAWPSPYQQH